MTFAVDVAKAQQYALLTNHEQSPSTLVKWHVLETTTPIDEPKQLNCPVTAVMESTGACGDAACAINFDGPALKSIQPAPNGCMTPKKSLMAYPPPAGCQSGLLDRQVV